MKRRAIIFVIVVAVLALAAFVGYRHLYPPPNLGADGYVSAHLYPPPPNLSADGYVSAHFDFRRLSSLPSFQAGTSDSQVVQALTEVLATGRPDENCRCSALATVTLKGPGDKQFVFHLKPAHSDDDCQFLIEGDRYSVDRKAFLAAIAPLGIPVERVTGPGPVTGHAPRNPWK